MFNLFLSNQWPPSVIAQSSPIAARKSISFVSLVNAMGMTNCNQIILQIFRSRHKTCMISVRMFVIRST